MSRPGDPESTISAVGATVDARPPGSPLPKAADTPVAERETQPGPPPSTVGVRDPNELPIVPRERYEIIGEHARGGMGRILLAVDRRLGRRVALKEILPRPGRDATRFVREALVTAHLEHPSIVPVHEIGRWPEGVPFYVMKFVSGRSLEEVLRGCQSFPERLAQLPTVIAVAEAVAYAHSRRIIHRDLKPSNVVLGEFGVSMVVDWGLAKQLGQEDPEGPATPDTPHSSATPDSRSREPLDSSEETVAGAVVGTPGYMAPEQAAGEKLDARADVFALGAILYTVLAGRAPYRGESTAELLSAVRAGPPPPLAQQVPEAPRELVAIVDKAMARERDRRYPSARELVADLKRFQSGQLVGAHHYSLTALVRRWLYRHRLAVSAAGAGLLALAVTGGFAMRRVVRERDRAEAAQRVAERARAQAERARAAEAARVDELTIAEARAALDQNPTGTIGWLDRLAPTSAHWPEARRLAAAAEARGVAAARLPGTRFAFSRSGDELLTGDGLGRVRAFGANGSARATLSVDGPVRAFAYAADGARLIVTGTRNLWIWPRGEKSADRIAAEGALDRLAVSEDGKWAAAGGGSSCAIYDLTSTPPRRRFTVAGCEGARFSPDSTEVAVRTAREVSLWSLANGAQLARWPELAGASALAFRPHAEELAVGGARGLTLLPLAGGRAHVLDDTVPVSTLAISPDGKSLAAGRSDGSLRLYDLASGASRQLSHPGAECRAIVFASDGRHLAATRGPTTRIWDLPSVELKKLRGYQIDVSEVGFAPDGKTLAVSAPEGGVQLWRLDREVPRYELDLKPDERVLALGGSTAIAAQASTLSARTLGRPGARILGDQVPIALALSEDGQRRLSVAKDGTLAMRSAEGAPEEVWGRFSQAAAVALAPDAGVAIATDGQHQIERGTAAGVQVVGTLPGKVRAIALSSDGKNLALLGADGSVYRAPAAGGSPSRIGDAPGDDLITLSQDGTRIATARAGGRLVHLWRSAPAPLAERVDDEVTTLAFVDDQFLAIGGRSGTVRMIDVARGLGFTLAGHDAPIVALSVASKDRRLTSLSRDGVARVWSPLPPEDPGRLRKWLAGLAVIDEGG